MDYIRWLTLGSFIFAGVCSIASSTLIEIGERTGCPEKWYPFKNKCYAAFGRTQTEKIGWKDASSNCSAKYDGTLASIHSQDEQDFLYSYVLLQFGERMWIGLTDARTEGEYMWEDDSPYDFEAWASPHEPSDAKINDTRTEDCVELFHFPNHFYEGRWNDEHCTTKMAYICQKLKDIELSGRNPMYCLKSHGGGYRLKKSCYHLIKEAKTWSEAEKHCLELNRGEIARILDRNTHIFITYVVMQNPPLSSYWIQRDIASAPGKHWVLVANNTKWDLRDNTEANSFICEHPPREIRKSSPPKKKTSTEDNEVASEVGNSMCPDDWYPFGKKCYIAVGRGRLQKATWDEASQSCSENYDGALVSIHSQAEQDFLFAFVLLQLEERIWIGLNDQSVEGQYAWDDASELDFQAWTPDEPSDAKLPVSLRDEDCVEMFYFSYLQIDGRWNDENCYNRLAYMCQIDRDAEKSGRNPMYCPESRGGGYLLQDTCYHIVKEAKTWKEAESYCVSTYSGNLATIKSSAVQFFIAYVLKQFATNTSHWIGLQNVVEGQPMQWSSGLPVTFTSWEKALDVLLKEKYVQIYDPVSKKLKVLQNVCSHTSGPDKWNLVSCTERLPFICENSKENTSTYLSSTTNRAPCPKTPVFWLDFGGDYCYYVQAEIPKSWYEAHFQCLKIGGTLASFHSPEEHDRLVEILRRAARPIYIGMFKRKEDNKFVWVDNSQVDFELWDQNEPNGDHEECVHIDNTWKWNDISCNAEFGYVCSVKRGSLNGTGSECDKCRLGYLSGAAVTAVAMCVLLVIVLLGLFAYFCINWELEMTKRRKKSIDPLQTPLTSRTAEIVIREDNVFFET